MSQPKPEKLNMRAYWLFLTIFVGLGVYLRIKIMDAPFRPLRFDQDIMTHRGSNIWEIIFSDAQSDYHRLIFIYRNAFSNVLYDLFGVNGYSYRTFSVLVSLATLFLIWKFVKQEFGQRESCVAVFLFGISHYALHVVDHPYWGEFYMFGSFLTFYGLWFGIRTGRGKYWLLLGIANFLNLTQTLVSGLFIPVIFVTGILLLKDELKGTSFPYWMSAKFRRFMVSLVGSLAMVFGMYYLRGLNLLSGLIQLINPDRNWQTISNISNDVSLTQDPSPWYSLKSLLYTVFITFNFEWGDSSAEESIMGTTLGHLSYFALFVLGLWKLWKTHRSIFWITSSIFSVSILTLALVLLISKTRYIAFILPFYLITVSVGVVYGFELLNYFFPWRRLGSSVFYIGVFIIFSWLIQPQFLFTSRAIDKEFHTEGIRGIRDYLRKHLKYNDIILNVTNQVELRNVIGDALTLHTYGFYLKQFFTNHRLGLLPLRKGKIGVWLVLRKPLKGKVNGKKVFPFYFPKNYFPEIIYRVEDGLLYFAEIEIPDARDQTPNGPLDTPFWNFISARELQLTMQLDLAESYYQRALESGFNQALIFYNLGILHLKIDLEKARAYFVESINVLEKLKKVNVKLHNADFSSGTRNKKGLPIDEPKAYGLRSYYSSKNGIKYQNFYIKDLMSLKPREYSDYFFTPGRIYYDQYSKTGRLEYFNIAMNLLNEGLKINPESIVKNVVARLNKTKSRTKILLNRPSIKNLNEKQEAYPPLFR